MRLRKTIAIFSSTTLCVAVAAAAGPVDPPAGPVGSTMKTLSQVEPRTPISAATTPGDESFPPSVFKITQPGSYYLTGNFQVPADKVGIKIAASDVTVDLGGFTITSGLAGVYAVPPGGPGVPLLNVRVAHGTVRGATAFGVGLDSVTSARVEGVTAVDCDYGVSAGEGGIVADCVAESCGSGLQGGARSVARNSTAKGSENLGFYFGDGSTLSGCLAVQNGGYGYIIGNGSTVTACVARDNATVGIGVLQDCVIADCAAQENGTDGITTGQGCVVRDSTAGTSGRHGFAVIAGTTVQGCTARGNGEDGINASWQCRLVGNTCQGNGATIAAGAGIRVTSWGSRVEENTLFGNDQGLIVSGTDNIIVKNTAKNTGTNFNVVAGNELAPVISNPGSNSFSTATPWSNFAY